MYVADTLAVQVLTGQVAGLGEQRQQPFKELRVVV